MQVDTKSTARLEKASGKTLHKGSKASCKLKGKAGKKYTYKVRVFQKVENKVIYGQYSNTKSAKIKK